MHGYLERLEDRLATLVMGLLQPSLKREEGQTLVEYALIIGVVAVGLVASLTALRTQIEGLFNVVSTGLAGA